MKLDALVEPVSAKFEEGLQVLTKSTNSGTTLLRVCSNSNPAAVAGAIAGVIRETGHCEVQAIGAGAVNQTVKAIGIARGYVAPAGINLITIPAFLDIEVNGEERTAIRFIIEPR
jgi:stage V sporulation protein S